MARSLTGAMEWWLWIGRASDSVTVAAGPAGSSQGAGFPEGQGEERAACVGNDQIAGMVADGGGGLESEHLIHPCVQRVKWRGERSGRGAELLGRLQLLVG